MSPIGAHYFGPSCAVSNRWRCRFERVHGWNRRDAWVYNNAMRGCAVMAGVLLAACSTSSQPSSSTVSPSARASLAASPVHTTTSQLLLRRTVQMTNVVISATSPATFEQIHPVPADIVLITSSAADLLACPGGWNGTVDA